LSIKNMRYDMVLNGACVGGVRGAWLNLVRVGDAGIQTEKRRQERKDTCSNGHRWGGGKNRTSVEQGV